MAQPETGGVRTTDGDSDKLETLSDDEEITIPSQDRDRKIADVRNIDIRDEQSENTQQEDWLLPTEPMHGARPRQTGGERLPAMENPVFRDEAEIYVVQRPSGTLRLSPGWRIVMEEETFTPPRGGGGVQPLSLRVCNERYLKLFRRTDREKLQVAGRDAGEHGFTHAGRLDHTPGRESHTQNASYLTCDTGSSAGGAHNDESAAVRLLVGNNITKCLRQLCGRISRTMIQQHCNCFRIWKEMR